VVARAASWSRPADGRLAALLALAGACLFIGSWTLLHHGVFARHQIVDTPLYQRYGEAIERGELPYRDFAVEYPPAALPVFALPALTSGDDDAYRRHFEALMAAFGVAAVLAVAATLAAMGAAASRMAVAVAGTALWPLALGSVVTTRFDLWPAALTAAALAALTAGRLRLGHGLLGLAVGAKLYPAVLVPVFLAFVWRTRGRREALVSAGVLAGVVAACFVPFLAVAPTGVWDSVSGQLGRPLQIESLGSALLLSAHQLAGLGLVVRSSHGSQNLAGTLPDVVAAFSTLAQAAVVVLVWRRFAMGPAGREALLHASAAALCAFVALGKVLSPQFLIWLAPVVPLLRARAAATLLAAAFVLTQLWFPYRYWDLVGLAALPSALVVARDLVLVALLATLMRPAPGPARTT
jgi:hypothetical protein